MSNSDDILPAIKEVGNRLRRKAMKALRPAEHPVPHYPGGNMSLRQLDALERLAGGNRDADSLVVLQELIERHDYYCIHAGDRRIRSRIDDGAR